MRKRDNNLTDEQMIADKKPVAEETAEPEKVASEEVAEEKAEPEESADEVEEE